MDTQENTYDESRLDTAIEEVIERVRPWTMVSHQNLVTTLQLVTHAVAHQIPGVLVECGVWRGGCSAAMLLIQREMFGAVLRPIYLLDSFEGLPPAVESKDGPLAMAYQRQEYATYYDNCRAGVDEARAAMTAMEMVEGRDYFLVPGWFDSTAPRLAQDFRDSGQAIALLRLDGDWYESTWECLEALEPVLTPDAAIVVDDYYTWDGCTRAVHDYLSRYDLPYRLQSMPQCVGAYLIKRDVYRAQRTELDGELERLQAALAVRNARIGQLEYAPPPTLILRGIRQLVLPLASRRYRVYRRIRQAGYRLARGRHSPLTSTVGTLSSE